MIIFKPHQAPTIIQPYLPANPIIIEAGVFIGKDTQRLATMWPNGIVYAFEPVPELFTQLQTNTAHLPNVYCYQVALSEKCATAPLYLSENPSKKGNISQANSLRQPKERLKHSPLEFNRSIQVPTLTLNEWTQQQGINSIDMLWLDTQGHEQSIVMGARTLLPTIKVIFTEVGFIEAYEGQMSFDQLTQWLWQFNFELVGKDFSTTTDWFFGNALYVRSPSSF